MQMRRKKQGTFWPVLIIIITAFMVNILVMSIYGKHAIYGKYDHRLRSCAGGEGGGGFEKEEEEEEMARRRRAWIDGCTDMRNINSWLTR